MILIFFETEILRIIDVIAELEKWIAVIYRNIRYVHNLNSLNKSNSITCNSCNWSSSANSKNKQIQPPRLLYLTRVYNNVHLRQLTFRKRHRHYRHRSAAHINNLIALIIYYYKPSRVLSPSLFLFLSSCHSIYNKLNVFMGLATNLASL